MSDALRSEIDYESALLELERLWGASAGTPEGERLDRLETLIGDYEERYHPMDPPLAASGREAN
jgi:HTH-type transcriptional regulator/antitoxin HigA